MHRPTEKKALLVDKSPVVVLAEDGAVAQNGEETATQDDKDLFAASRWDHAQLEAGEACEWVRPGGLGCNEGRRFGGRATAEETETSERVVVGEALVDQGLEVLVAFLIVTVLRAEPDIDVGEGADEGENQGNHHVDSQFEEG